MNDTIKDFTQQKIKEGLKVLPNNWQLMFKRMYSHNNLEATIDNVVDNLSEDKLSHALDQVERSLLKIKNKLKKGT